MVLFLFSCFVILNECEETLFVQQSQPATGDVSTSAQHDNIIQLLFSFLQYRFHIGKVKVCF
jgi:hypothetical protein